MQCLCVGKKRGLNGGPVLSWSARCRISTGIAEAIQYLRNGTERCIVHRDIKPSNILVSFKKTPKVMKNLVIFLNHMTKFHA